MTAPQTIEEQFAEMAVVNAEGIKVVRAEDVKKAVGLTQPWFDDLLVRIAGGNTLGEIEVDSFVGFLETGSVPTVASVAEPKRPPSRSRDDRGASPRHPPQLPPLPHLDARVTKATARSPRCLARSR